MRPAAPPRAAAALAVAALAVAGCAGGGDGGAVPGAPPLASSLGGVVGPRTLSAADVVATGCPGALADALEGRSPLSLAPAATCRLDVLARGGLLVRPRTVRFSVVSGSVAVRIVQRGRGDSLTMGDDLAGGDDGAATFGKDGGTVAFTCLTACALRFEP